MIVRHVRGCKHVAAKLYAEPSAAIFVAFAAGNASVSRLGRFHARMRRLVASRTTTKIYSLFDHLGKDHDILPDLDLRDIFDEIA